MFDKPTYAIVLHFCENNGSFFVKHYSFPAEMLVINYHLHL